MISETSMKHHLGVKEPNIKEANWRYLLRKYRSGSISIIEEYVLRLYAEVYGINLD